MKKTSHRIIPKLVILLSILASAAAVLAFSGIWADMFDQKSWDTGFRVIIFLIIIFWLFFSSKAANLVESRARDRMLGLYVSVDIERTLGPAVRVMCALVSISVLLILIEFLIRVGGNLLPTELWRRSILMLAISTVFGALAIAGRVPRWFVQKINRIRYWNEKSR